MDGVHLLAARFPCGLLTAQSPSCPPRVVACKGFGVIRRGPKSGPPTGGRVENGRAGRSVSSKRYKHIAPGEARSPRALPTFPSVRPGSASTCPKGASAMKSRLESRARRAVPPVREAPQDARRKRSEAAAAGLFDGVEGIEVALSGDLEALAKLATVTSGRAMTGRLWSEARALAGLAETYARLGERAAGARGGGGTIATIDLGLLLEIIVDPDGAVTQRFARKDEGANDPDAALKAHYWDYQAARHRAVGNNTRELMMRAVYAEKRLGELGHEARVNVTDVEIEAWVRDWLSAPPSEANLARRTKIGEWPWR